MAEKIPDFRVLIERRNGATAVEMAGEQDAILAGITTLAAKAIITVEQDPSAQRDLLRTMVGQILSHLPTDETDPCVSMGCQCSQCKKNAFDPICCMERDIACPNDPEYDPNYRCPEFTPKEEVQDGQG